MAEQLNIPVYQFKKIRLEGVDTLKSIDADVMVTASYGQILSQEVLNIAKHGVINVHASLLPKYRGASPIQTAIMHGDAETGVTIMKTEMGLDTGDIMGMVSTPIFEHETAGDLTARLSLLGANLLLEVIEQIENGTVKYVEQEQFHVTVTAKIKKEDCLINWEKSSKEIKCLILGTNPNPVARTLLGDQQVKIYKAKVVDFALSDEEKTLEPGTVLPSSSAKRGVFVKTGDTAIELLDMQLPGGKLLPAKVLMNGRKIQPNDKFKTVMQIV